jgi:D-3-phosphoglycerate dehydrogenase
MGEMRPYLELAEKLGRFQGQLCPGSVEQVDVEYAGDAADLNVAPLTVAVLKGLLESATDQVNMVNAPVLARERGIKVVESKTSASSDFASTISTRVKGCGERLVVGAIFHGKQPRIVRVDDFMLEAIPEGPTLLLHNHDRPGVVGQVGALLGEAGVNISRMQLALVRERGEACMLVNIDVPPNDSVMQALRDIENMISAQLVELGS